MVNRLNTIPLGGLIESLYSGLKGISRVKWGQFAKGV